MSGESTTGESAVPTESFSESAIRYAREALEQADKRGDLVLHVRTDGNPIEGLIELRAHLVNLLEGSGRIFSNASLEARNGLALGIANLDRVIARLDECKVRHVYRGRK